MRDLLYGLSSKYGPPSIDLKNGRIMDDYGDTSCAKVSVKHKIPEDVSREELDYYHDVYAFLNPEDLIFYLYPMWHEFKNDPSLNCIDNFVYSLEAGIDYLLTEIDESDIKIVSRALFDLLLTGPSGDPDYYQCPKLQNLMKIRMTDWDQWVSIQQVDTGNGT